MEQNLLVIFKCLCYLLEVGFPNGLVKTQSTGSASDLQIFYVHFVDEDQKFNYFRSQLYHCRQLP